MPSFLSRNFSAKKKDPKKVPESVSSPAPSSPPRFRILPSRSASRPPSSSSAVDGGASRMRSLLTRTTAARTGSRGGENSQTAASKPPGGAVGGGVVGSGVYDRPVSSGNNNPGQLSAQIRGPSPQRVNSPPIPQRGPSQANRQTSPFPPSRTPQQDYQQQLRRSTASPPIPSRGPSRGPSPYNGPYPSIQNQNQWPASFNPIDIAENFNVVDFYSRQGTPKLRNPSRNSTCSHPRSQSMTSEVGHYTIDGMERSRDGAPPSPRSITGPHLEADEKRSFQNIRHGNNNIASVMLGHRGPGGMGMGMSMAGLDGGLDSNMGSGNMPRRGGNIPPIPRIPSMYKPSAQSVRNQNQMMNSNNYSQYPPAFRNGKPRNNQGHDGQLSQYFEFDGPSQSPVGRGQPPRMQSPRPFQPQPPHSPGPRGPGTGPPSQDQRCEKRLNPAISLLPTPGNSSTADNFNPARKAGSQQPQEQPAIPATLPTPSLTPTPPSRSNSNEDRQNSDEECVHEKGLEMPIRSTPAPVTNSTRMYKPWQENGQDHGYFRRPPPYQMIDPQHNGTSPPSPISAPATPVTSSSASSTHGHSNHVIAQQIKRSAPIMPGPVKEICYTKDINLVMEECMMGHGKVGAESVMRRTANWHHRVGCMLCGGYGGLGGEKVESGPSMAGKHWLWLCSWCALRVCTDCRCRLAEEEDNLREKGGNTTTLKVNLKDLRAKIIKEKKEVQERHSGEVIDQSLSGDKSERLLREEMEIQNVNMEALRAKVDLRKIDGLTASTNPTINQSRTQSPAPVAVQNNTLLASPSLAMPANSEESVNSFATAGSRVESNSSQGVIRPAIDLQSKRVEHPPRISSRNITTNVKIEASVPNRELVSPAPEPAAVAKQAEIPKHLPPQISNKTVINSSTNATIIVSSTVVPTPKSPESPSRNPLPASAAVASTALQAAVADTPKTDTTAASATFVHPSRGDSSLRSVVTPEMLALITGIPVSEQSKAAAVATKPAPTMPAKTQPPARGLAEAFVPPPVPAKSPPPSRDVTVSPPPPQSSSSTLLAPLIQAKSLTSSPSTPQLKNNKVWRKPASPSSATALPTTEKLLLPPLSFGSEISDEIDSIFESHGPTAPKAQATHAEDSYRQGAVESSPKGGRRWFKGLFSGRK